MKKTLSFLLCLVMLCLFLLSGCQAGFLANAPVNETEQQLDWELHCARISADGKVLETGIVCELTGVYTAAENATGVLSLELTTPDGYQYCIPNDSGNTTENKAEKWDFAEVDVPYFVSMWYGYNKTENVPQFAGFALDVGKGYFMIRWRGAQEFLVCAKDADADLTAVFEYFEVFRGSEIQNALSDIE